MTISPLSPLPGIRPCHGLVVLVILDGIGLGPQDASDGIFVSHTPVLDALLQEPLMVRLKAHGTAVGLPSDDDMGNSEVGHNALGAGRVFSQGARLVNEAIASGRVFEGETWRRVIQTGLDGGTVHFIGMVSDGNVHSHIDQLYALLEGCATAEVPRIRVHALLDGRDVDQKSASRYIEPLEARLDELSRIGRDYRIASGGGRMVTTMDRYNANWEVVEKGWQAHVLGNARPFASASEAIATYYQEDPKITDQYMESFVIVDDGNPVGTIEDGDAVVFFNFRGDRAIEISRAFEEETFTEFNRVRRPDVFYAGMMQYDGDAMIPRHFLVAPPTITGTVGEYLCASGVTSFTISETQKYGHVTYFWNGNKSGYINPDLETYEEILSDRIAFDLRPWMKAAEDSEQVVERIAQGNHRFIRVNLANGDMVGHTGVESAIRIAVATVDLCLGRILEAVAAADGIAVITSDHGNAECMWTEKGGKRSPMVAHTLNPVPFIIKDFCGRTTLRLAPVQQPGLANVAATLCTLLGLAPPQDYEPSLVSIQPTESSG